MTADEKLVLLIEQATLLRIKFRNAVNGLEGWEAVRHEHGQARRTLRSIQGTLHGIAKKIRQQKAQDNSSGGK